MKLNIDTTNVQFFCTKEAEARTDRETGAPRVDRETGEPQWQVQVAALDSTGGEVLKVTVNGRLEVAVGCPVAVEGLVAIPWSQGNLHRPAADRVRDLDGTQLRAGPPCRPAGDRRPG